MHNIDIETLLEMEDFMGLVYQPFFKIGGEKFYSKPPDFMSRYAGEKPLADIANLVNTGYVEVTPVFKAAEK